ncbi:MULTISPECIES: SDR family NAD(P)-dependent oxidoreductase [Pseudomonas]|uniref:SDR family NAD(P)-dependent oxidoreductase n=1 Tax=Pseudomonas quercus TaxID=2722792 RepID=A0ABX0Y8Z9_9PSED|nr:MULTISPECIES: SDR family NAD(P)-dependent oxidoreductase [Pseudomonas]MBF7141206.1 SDR family NAD(P)-dependent oxidoreductase [Pseudomonas sp. LY10J]NJO99741.1 SDR family NAD(P)-dependent oxidoreductase [Pseudomonas quercus]
MNSLPQPYHALIIGATGTLGSAFAECLNQDPHCAGVVGLGRSTTPPLDLGLPNTIMAAAAQLAGQAPFDLIILATGVLHGEGFMPEKTLEALNQEQLLATFQANALGPALVLQQFLPLLSANGVMAVLSAKVGSIEDNRLGGWYSYRASKAALNMLVKTAAIESARRWPHKRLVALHPGTVTSPLSRPFRREARAPREAAADMLQVLDALRPEDHGGFFSYSGERLPW